MEGQDVKGQEVYKEKKLLGEREAEKNKGKREIRTGVLREESEQCIILCKNCLIGQVCDKPYIYINFDLQ